MKAAYWCVVCKNCIAAIPLLELDLTKQRHNPPEFLATCLRCKRTTMFSELDIDQPQQIETVAGFVPVKGFSNV